MAAPVAAAGLAGAGGGGASSAAMLGAAGIGGGAGLAGGVYSASQNRKAATKAYERSKQLMYDAPRITKEGLKAAGLNPILAATQGTSAPGVSPQAPTQNPASGSVADAKNLAGMALLKASTDKERADAEAAVNAAAASALDLERKQWQMQYYRANPDLQEAALLSEMGISPHMAVSASVISKWANRAAQAGKDFLKTGQKVKSQYIDKRVKKRLDRKKWERERTKKTSYPTTPYTQ